MLNVLPVGVLNNFKLRRSFSQVSNDRRAGTTNTLRIGIIPEYSLLNQQLLPSSFFFISFGHRDSVYATGRSTAMASCNVVVAPPALGPSEKLSFQGIWLAIKLRPDLMPCPTPNVEIDDPFQYGVFALRESMQVQACIVDLSVIPRIGRDGRPNLFVEILKIALAALAKPPAAGTNVFRLPFCASLDLPGGVAAEIVSILQPETVDCVAGHFADCPQIADNSLRQMAQPAVNRSYATFNPLDVDRFARRVVILNTNGCQIPGEAVVVLGNDDEAHK